MLLSITKGPTYVFDRFLTELVMNPREITPFGTQMIGSFQSILETTY